MEGKRENQNMFVIAGLGNPGEKYDRSWHNCGFMVLEILAERHHFSMRKIRFKSLTAELTLFGKKVIFLAPQTYMNNSGEAIRAVMDYYRLPPENLLLIYDDIDVPVGHVRIRPFGGAGTHNGMKSVIEKLNNDRFPRIRVGIGPKPEELDMIAYVLQKIPEERQKTAYEGLVKAADAVEYFLRETLDIAMNRLNGT